MSRMNAISAFAMPNLNRPSSELGYERFKLPVAFLGQKLPGVAHDPVGVELALLGHEHGFDVADVLRPVEDFFEHDQVLGGVNTDRAAFQIALGAAVKDLVMKGVPGKEQFGSDAAARER